MEGRLLFPLRAKIKVVRDTVGDILNWILFGVVQIELLFLLVRQESIRIRLKEWIHWIKHVYDVLEEWSKSRNENNN